MSRVTVLALGVLMVLVTGASSAHAAGQVRAGAAVIDGTYNVGSSAGQYASTRDGGYGDPDPHAQSVKNQASYGVQSNVEEMRVRRTDRPPLRRNPDGSEAPVTFEIGPVDYPDMAKEPVATGARFLTGTRGYSAAGPDEVEHYCLDCRFRDWMDATGDLTAEVTFVGAGGERVTEKVEAVDGRFRTQREAGQGEAVKIVIRDAWGNTSGEPETL